jgi:formate dehydrogenase major subunit
MVTDRMRSLKIGDRVVHQVGLPYHWGSKGLSIGDSANDLTHIGLDSNVHIQEKPITCDVLPGRRPRGKALEELLDDYRKRAGSIGAAQ